MAGLYVSAMLVLGLGYMLFGWIGQEPDIADLETKRRAMAVAVTHMYGYSAGALLVLAMGARALQLGLRPVTESRSGSSS